MQVNLAKTKEIVFYRPNARNVLFPSELPGIERVLCAELLGVWLQADMGMIRCERGSSVVLNR